MVAPTFVRVDTGLRIFSIRVICFPGATGSGRASTKGRWIRVGAVETAEDRAMGGGVFGVLLPKVLETGVGTCVRSFFAALQEGPRRCR